MKKISYVYRVKQKPSVLLDYGFSYYEGDGEKIYACPLVLDINGEIPQHLIKALERIHKHNEFGLDFSEYEFDADGNLILTDELREQFTHCQLCAYPDEKYLFINSPDRVAYYDATSIRNVAEKAVSALLEGNIVYRKRIKCSK